MGTRDDTTDTGHPHANALKSMSPRTSGCACLLNLSLSPCTNLLCYASHAMDWDQGSKMWGLVLFDGDNGGAKRASTKLENCHLQKLVALSGRECIRLWVQQRPDNNATVRLILDYSGSAFGTVQYSWQLGNLPRCSCSSVDVDLN